MAKEEQPAEPIYEARDEKMVSPVEGNSIVRIARFLKPCAKHVNQAVSIPKTPLLCEVFPHNLQQWPSKVSFKGWNCPQRRWKQWVDKLAGKYSTVWIQTGIHDAIMCSIYEIRRNQELLLGLSEFWCSDTNTFVFPWGEATVTLEDIMILGGYPVLGEPVTSPLTEELEKIQEEMIKHRKEISRGKARKPAHSGWLNHFMEIESEFEHVAFLSLWLSRYVFPSISGETIGKYVFPIAAKLSQGIQVALAQAVLATLYQNLRILREKAIDSAEMISISGPFQLLQIWAFERFQLVGPNPKAPLDSVEPRETRVARWHKLSSKLNLPLVRSALRLAENFLWRPYANTNLKNWYHPSYYKEFEQMIIDCSSLEDQELRSFLRCLRGCELVGIDCKEKYLPHRVAMQFGMDQDLPAEVVSNFDLGNEFVNLFVPSRTFQPGVSMGYSNWWKDMMMAREGAIKEVLLQKIDLEECAAVEESASKKDCHLLEDSGDDDDGVPIARPVGNLRNEVSSDDNYDLHIVRRALTKKCNQSQNVASSTLRVVGGNSSERKLPMDNLRCEGSRDDNSDVPIARPMGNSRYEDSSDDNYNLVRRALTKKCNQSQNVASSTLRVVGGNSSERKLPMDNSRCEGSRDDNSDVPIASPMGNSHYEDSSDDNYNLVRRALTKKCNQSQNVASSTLRVVGGNSSERKLPMDNSRCEGSRDDNSDVPIARPMGNSRYEDSSDDNYNLVRRALTKKSNQSQNVASSTLRVVGGNSSERKLPMDNSRCEGSRDDNSDVPIARPMGNSLYEDSSDDNYDLVRRALTKKCNQSQNVASSTLRVVGGNGSERKLPMDNSHCKGSRDDNSDVPIARSMGNSRYEDSSDDNYDLQFVRMRALAKSTNESQNVASASGSLISGKRKLSSSKEGIFEGEAKASKSANNTNGFAKEVKREPGCSFNDQLDSAAKEKRGEGKMGGESLNNPIDLDDDDDYTSIFQKHGQDIEGRIRKLEKLLGVNQDL